MRACREQLPTPCCPDVLGRAGLVPSGKSPISDETPPIAVMTSQSPSFPAISLSSIWPVSGMFSAILTENTVGKTGQTVEYTRGVSETRDKYEWISLFDHIASESDVKWCQISLETSPSSLGPERIADGKGRCDSGPYTSCSFGFRVAIICCAGIHDPSDITVLSRRTSDCVCMPVSKATLTVQLEPPREEAVSCETRGARWFRELSGEN